jgi:hypothetical protein
MFNFDKVFDEGGETCSVYSECVRSIVESAMVGLHELNLVDSELEQAPGFNHRTRTYIKWSPGFQILLFKFNLCRYTEEGINGTVFAYGQTGSGKTHTIVGTRTDPGVMFLAVVGGCTSWIQFTHKLESAWWPNPWNL